MSTLALPQTKPTQTADFLPLKGTDHVEFYVGNARQSAYFYRAAFGMSLIAYAGPETGHRDRASYVLQQGKVRFVLTTALRADSEIARHVHTHGDGVRAIALWVDDARQAWTETTTRGARSVLSGYHVKEDGNLGQGLVLGPASCASREVLRHPGFLVSAKPAEDIDPEQHSHVPAAHVLFPHVMSHPPTRAHERDRRPR